MAFSFGRKHTLHDHLIRAPIPNAEDGRAEKDSSPGKIRVAHRLDHMEVAGRYASAQTGEASDAMQTYSGQNYRASNQDQRLNQVGVDQRRQPAGNRINS